MGAAETYREIEPRTSPWTWAALVAVFLAGAATLVVVAGISIDAHRPLVPQEVQRGSR